MPCKILFSNKSGLPKAAIVGALIGGIVYSKVS